MLSENFKQLPAEKRLSELRAICDRSEEKTIQRPLDEEELDALGREIASDSVKLSRANEEFDNVKSIHKQLIKEIKDPLAEKVSTFRNGHEEIETEIYWVRDEDNSRMIAFDIDGNDVESRRMLPEERQTNMLRSINNNH